VAPFRERFHVRLVRGELRGILPSLLRLLLAPPSWLFAGAAQGRSLLYQLGIFTRHRVPCPVVSVGNLSVGGTGKTPMVEWVVRELTLMGYRPAILSRGYGASGDEVPDELAVLAENLPDVRLVRDPDRVRGALTAIERHRADSVVLDDGFQHHRIDREIDLVTVDATNPFGGGHCLPRGMLREPLRALRRAEAVVLTRSDQVERRRAERILGKLGRSAPRAVLATAVHEPRSLRPLGGGGELPARWLQGRKVMAVSGIGNPGAFERTLLALGANLVERARFVDHQRYDGRLLEELGRAGSAAGAEAVVTTQKDAVKWGRGPIEGPPAFVLGVRIVFRRGEDGVRERIRDALRGSRETV
jgi:tetraacyldisaccharide 4'-kinase